MSTLCGKAVFSSDVITFLEEIWPILHTEMTLKNWETPSETDRIGGNSALESLLGGLNQTDVKL